MATYPSIRGYFEVTNVSFAPNVIPFGGETEYTITVKNLSGRKITSMYAIMQLVYKDVSGVMRTSNNVYLHGSDAFEFASISWASGTSKTFKGKFSPTAYYYKPTDENRLLDCYLTLDITTNVTFADGGNSDQIYNIDGINNEHLKVFATRYVPSISKFSAERSTGENADDEGENILAGIRLRLDDDSHADRLRLYLLYRDRGADGDYASIDLSGLMHDALMEEVITVITDIFNKNSDWELRLVYGDEFESVVSVLELSRAFANVHLSGASTGGVCFGSFSKATEGKPSFQCYYPAVFYAGIDGVTNYELGEVNTGGRWLNGETIYRSVVSGSVSTTAGTAKAEVIASIPNVETVVNMYGTVNRGGAVFPLSMYGADDNHHRTAFTSGNVQFTSTHSASVCVTIEYTKSTEEVS